MNPEQRIAIYPNKVLKTKCEIVLPDEDNDELISTMLNAMKNLKGLGLAANQLGVAKQIFVMNGLVVINPQICLRSGGNCVMIEGCLSFPGRRIRTKRSNKIGVAYYDREFKEITKELDGIESVIFQHEFDHLQGKTMLDREFNGRI